MNVSGLTFQTAADARAFDKGVKLAVEDIHAGDLLHSFSLHFSNFHSFSLLPLTISLTHTPAEQDILAGDSTLGHSDTHMNTHTLAFYCGILRVSHFLYMMSKGHVLAAMAMVILQCDAIGMFFGYTLPSLLNFTCGLQLLSLKKSVNRISN